MLNRRLRASDRGQKLELVGPFATSTYTLSERLETGDLALSQILVSPLELLVRDLEEDLKVLIKLKKWMSGLDPVRLKEVLGIQNKAELVDEHVVTEAQLIQLEFPELGYKPEEVVIRLIDNKLTVTVLYKHKIYYTDGVEVSVFNRELQQSFNLKTSELILDSNSMRRVKIQLRIDDEGRMVFSEDYSNTM